MQQHGYYLKQQSNITLRCLVFVNHKTVTILKLTCEILKLIIDIINMSNQPSTTLTGLGRRQGAPGLAVHPNHAGRGPVII